MNNKNVNALIAHELLGFACTCSLTNEQEISILHKAALCGIEIYYSIFIHCTNSDFLISELKQVNPDNSRAMSMLTCKHILMAFP